MSSSEEQRHLVGHRRHSSHLLAPGKRGRRRSELEDDDDSSSGSEDETSSDNASSDDDEDQRRVPSEPPHHLLYGVVFVTGLAVILLVSWAVLRYIHALGGSSDAAESVSAPSKTSATAAVSARTSTKLPTGTSEFSSRASKTVSTSPASPSSTSGGSSSSSGSGPGMFGVVDDMCGDSGAVEEPGPGVGPNGAQSWLNCGLSETDKSAKWTPPKLDISKLKYMDLAEAVKLDIFKPCVKWVDLFDRVGADAGLPPIFLASIALTESTCRGDAVAPGGASWGLMQITTEKCGEAPGGNCNDPEFNVKKGADYFNTVLKENDGSFLLALGSYNGWPNGMTWESATAYASSDCVRQNNLDYLQSNLNGWMQGVDGNSIRTIRNLERCGGG